MIEINSISELLETFIPAEVKNIEQTIDEYNISHPVTIGSMYEGLTKEVVNQSIFAGLNLKIITNSHIEGCKNEFDVVASVYFFQMAELPLQKIKVVD